MCQSLQDMLDAMEDAYQEEQDREEVMEDAYQEEQAA